MAARWTPANTHGDGGGDGGFSVMSGESFGGWVDGTVGAESVYLGPWAGARDGHSLKKVRKIVLNAA